jgi:hypothetical protein
MLTARDLRNYYPSHDGTADGAALTAHVVDVGSTATAIICDELTGADDYVNDWTVMGISGTNLANVAAHVKDFTASTDTITLARALAGTAEAGDTFYLIPSGAGDYRSTTEIPGLAATALSAVTGVALGYVSPLCGTGTAYFEFNRSGTSLALKAPGDTNYGAAVAVASGTYSLFSADEDKALDVIVTEGSLPIADGTDSSTLTRQEGRLFPNTEGYESQTGIIRYRAFFVKNDGTDTAHEVAAYLTGRTSGTSTLSTAAAAGTTAFDLADASGFPARSFWLHNDAADDFRYIKYRSGNTLYPAAVTWGKLSFDGGGTTAIAVGDMVTGGTSAATGEVMAIGVTSGAWATSDAAGTIYLKDLSGTFTNNEGLEVSGVERALAAADSSLGYRDGTYTAAWGTAVAVSCAPDIDIARAALSTNALPSDLTALSFSAPMTAASGVALGGGEMAAAELDGVCLRQVVVDGAYPVDDVVMQMRIRSW